MEVLKDEFNFIYFVSYSWTGELGNGNGMIELKRFEEINNYDDLLGICKLIQNNNNFDNVVIINYILLPNNKQKED